VSLSEAFRTNQRGATPYQTLGIGAPSRRRGLGYIVHSRVTEESLTWAYLGEVRRPERRLWGTEECLVSARSPITSLCGANAKHVLMQIRLSGFFQHQAAFSCSITRLPT